VCPRTRAFFFTGASPTWNFEAGSVDVPMRTGDIRTSMSASSSSMVPLTVPTAEVVEPDAARHERYAALVDRYDALTRMLLEHEDLLTT